MEKTKISVLNALQDSTLKALMRAEITTVEDLIKKCTDGTVVDVRGIGSVQMLDISNALYEYNGTVIDVDIPTITFKNLVDICSNIVKGHNNGCISDDNFCKFINDYTTKVTEANTVLSLDLTESTHVKKIPLICVLGESGSGKDYLTNFVIEHDGNHTITKLGKVTTRPKRPDEKLTYDKFMTDDEFLSSKEIFAPSAFETEHGIWRYGFIRPKMNPGTRAILAVTDIEQCAKIIKEYKNSSTFEVYCIRVETPDKERFIKSMDREPDMYRLCSRFIKDFDDFSDNNKLFNDIVSSENSYIFGNNYSDYAGSVFMTLINDIINNCYLKSSYQTLLSL